MYLSSHRKIQIKTILWLHCIMTKISKTTYNKCLSGYWIKRILDGGEVLIESNTVEI